jgi:hypothetical protein
MKPNNTVTHRTPVLSPTESAAFKSTDKATGSEPMYDDIYVQPRTILRAKHRGIDENFVHLIKKIALLALDGFERGGTVDSTMLCADIRYGLSNDKPVGGTSVPGLCKDERQFAGRVVWLLADAEELPLESLGPNKANLQQYRVK